jgi:hypothetical protein
MRRRSGLPGPIARLRRDPLAIVGAVLVALLAATSAGIHETASLRVTGFVDGHWRGAYDILVRPAGARLNLEQTNGFVEPNFLGFAGGGGISLDQLAAIRNASGVELAAPIGFVGYLHGDAPSAVINLDHLPAKPTLYRVMLTTTTTDGLSRQVVQSEVGEVLLGPPAKGDNPAANWATSLAGLGVGRDAAGGWNVGISSGRALPDLAVPVIAVDPKAERELLAGNADFLDALEKMGASGSRTAGSFDLGLVASGYMDAAAGLADIQSPDYPWPSDRQLPVIPLVVSSRQAADLRVDLEVEQIGQPLDSYPSGVAGTDALTAAEKAVGPGLTLVGSTAVDAGSTLAPFRQPQLLVAWPGSSAAGGSYGIYQGSTVDTRLVVRPGYGPAPTTGPDAGAPAYQITPIGIVGPDGDPTAPQWGATGLSHGAFQAYRELRSVPLAAGLTGFKAHGPIRQPFLLAPVGTFDATAVKVPSDPLDYVPLGAYDPADTTYIADPSGKAVTPTQMQYPLLPNGLVTTPPLAITDLLGAVALRGASPIDAVRIRVSGVTDFGPESQSKIEAVAAAISRMGFDVDIVAGSSPQEIDLYVPEYHADQKPPTDLGWVRQHWTTIGAAQRVVSGFDEADLALLVLCLLATVVWAFALSALRTERRVRDVGVLKAIGWGRLEMLRWLMGEPIVAGVAIAALAGLGYAVGGRNPEALAVGLGMALVWVAAGLLAGLDAMRRGRPTALTEAASMPGGASALVVRGRASYAIRAAVSRWPWVLSTSVGLAAGATAIAVASAILIGLGERIGPTLLASATGSAVVLYQPLALAVIGFGSLVFVVAALRLDRRRRAPEALILSVSGWSSGEIEALLWLGLVVVGCVAVVLAGVASLLLAGPFKIGAGPAAALGAMALAGSVVVWGRWVTRGVRVKPGEIT